MKWISLLVMLLATTAIGNEHLMSWDFEVIQIDGTIHSGILYLNKDGDLIGTLVDDENDQFIQAYGWVINEEDEEIISLQHEL